MQRGYREVRALRRHSHGELEAGGARKALVRGETCACLLAGERERGHRPSTPEIRTTALPGSERPSGSRVG
jgi:hypothetical protein